MEKQCTCMICDISYPCDNMRKLCPGCRTVDKNVFNLIREFLYAFPGASINEVTKETGISSSLVLKYLREGRIETVGGLNVIECEECGISISHGHLCNKCQEARIRSFTSTSVKSKSTSQVMYTKKKK